MVENSVRRALTLLFVAVASLAASASSGPSPADREPDRATFDTVVKPFL